MKRTSYCMWLVVLILGMMLITNGGCGGGGGEGDGIPIPTPSPTPVPEPEYIPMPVTQEELDETEREGRVDVELDKMLLPDGSYVKDYFDIPLPWDAVAGAASTKNGIATNPQPVTQVQMNVILARIQRRAWELTNRELEGATRNTNFREGDPKTQPGEGHDFGQRRYVYIYPPKEGYPELGACNRRQVQWHPQGVAIGEPDGTSVGMFGMDCVGFLRECLAAAGEGIIRPSPSIGPYRLARDWREWIPDSINSPITIEVVQDENYIRDNPPQPGDILIYRGHVALCVAQDTDGDGVKEIAIAHSRGKVPDFDDNDEMIRRNAYTAAEYRTSQNMTPDQIGVELKSNGPMVQNYEWTVNPTDRTRSRYPHRETTRLRLVPKVQAEEVGYVTLTWGAEPLDLDTHFTGPADGGGRFHIWFSRMDDENANLDVDDVSSWGPEVLTWKLLRGGRYSYFVHNYSNQSDSLYNKELSNSGAKVVFRATHGAISNVDQSLVFTVPPDQAGSVWHVFDVEVNETVTEVVLIEKNVLLPAKDVIQSAGGVMQKSWIK